MQDSSCRHIVIIKQKLKLYKTHLDWESFRLAPFVFFLKFFFHTTDKFWLYQRYWTSFCSEIIIFPHDLAEGDTISAA